MLNATYRLQLTPDFGFDAAAALAPYLQRLGISHVYLSPHLQAAPGSTHGYDVIDHANVSRELGGTAAHARMFEAFRAHGLSVVIDVVPNHMSIAKAEDNPWWWDVLENGPSSRWADYFDVDWGHPDARNRNRVVLPVLGDHYGRVLDERQISVVRDGGRIVLKVYDNLYPVGPRSIGWVLQPVAAKLQNDALAFIADVLEDLPSPTELDDESRRRRHRHKSGAGTLLAQIIEDDSAVATAIDERLSSLSENLDQLDALVERLNFRLVYWRAARFDLDYRRFFDINELVGLRMDQAKVFADTHALILSWVKAGFVTGLRIDHPDGLIDPQGYFERLRAHAPETWIVVEKILERDEPLPKAWPVQGTTGYDFGFRVSGLWIDRAAQSAFDTLYTTFTGAETAQFAPVAIQKKRDIVRQVLAADVRRITERFLDVCEQRRTYRDVTRDELKTVIETMLIALPVYRTYGHPNGECSEHDREVIEAATRDALAVRPEIDVRLFELVRDVLTGTLRGAAETEAKLRFQQASGPIMAKGVEDTAFYTYQRFIACNEVGGDPERFGISVDDFHTYNTRKQAEWPVAMVGTSTHDTKRSEDVRARLAVLTEMPDVWRDAVTRWSERSASYRAAGVDRSIEYHIYQTLVGAWPIDGERLKRYLEKAMREAKVFSSWTRIDETYEAAVQAFAAGLLADASFVADMSAFVDTIARAGEDNALAQKLLTLTVPGVPDIYQGTEVYDYSLTDPDNRRAVDYATRASLLDEAVTADRCAAIAGWDRGLAKLWLVTQALRVRRESSECFDERATYEPLGSYDERVIAFVRGSTASKKRVLVVTTRLRTKTLGDTRFELPPGDWRDALNHNAKLTGTVQLAELLGGLPVALLTSD